MTISPAPDGAGLEVLFSISFEEGNDTRNSDFLSRLSVSIPS